WPQPHRDDAAENAHVRGQVVLHRRNDGGRSDDAALAAMLQSGPAAVFLAGARPGKDVLRRAEEQGVPLVWSGSGSAFGQTAEQFAAARHGRNRLDEVRRGLLRAASDGTGLPAMTHELAGLLGNPVLMIDRYLHLLGYQGDGTEPDPDALVPLLVSLQGAFRPPTGMVTGDLDLYRVERGDAEVAGRDFSFLAAPIGEEEVLGLVLVLEVNHPTGVADLFWVREVASAAAFEMSRWRSLIRTEQKYQSEFVNDLVYNNFESRASLLERASVWGWNLDLPHSVVVLELGGFGERQPDRQTIEEFHALLESAGSQREGEPIAVRHGERCIVLVSPLPEETAAEGRARLQRLFQRWKERVDRWRPGQTLCAGAGNSFDVTELYRSYQEAKTALEIGRSLNGEGTLALFRDLGVFRLLYTQGDQELREFWDETMGALADHDAQHSGDLIATLRTYLDCGGDLSETAGRLFIHPNTLRYRLDKIREITGKDVRLTEDRVNLYMALRVGDLRKF
ncbi:MAG: PucR family transcriptional regulator, partial [Bacillota bacterium]